MSLDKSMSSAIFSNMQDKTFLDKLFARREVDKLKELMRKSPLSREDMLEIMYMIAGTEAKLVNFNEWDRHVILKYYVWVREYMRMVERRFDFQEWLDKKKIKISKQSKRLFDHTRGNMEHDVKYLVDVYLNIMRTSLSLGGSGFFEPMKQKAEIAYPFGFPAQQTQVQNSEGKKYLWGK